DRWNIKVAVRHGLPANLNKSDNRNQCSQEPKPAYDEVGPEFPLEKTECRNSNQKQRRADDLPDRYAGPGDWEKHGKIIRQESDEKFFRIGDKRVRQPQRNSSFREGAHAASMR